MLIGKKGVAMVGDNYGQEFDDFAAANLPLTRVTTSEAAFDMLSSGAADYFLYSLYAGDDVRAFGVFDKRVARCRPNVPQRARGT